MIRVEDITKFYQTNLGRHYVLRDTSFYIPPLAKVGVVGRNGAGKSTLMRLLAGIDMPNKGRVVREGLISWPLGLATGLQSAMTGRENSRFACRIQGLGFAEMPEILDFIQAFSEIGRYFDEPVRSYSSGMKARLNFAIAMAFNFDCYLIDELTAVGDEVFKQKSRAMFEQKKSTSGFVLVSHSMSQLLSECESGLLIYEGTAQYFESIEEAVGRYRSLIGVDEEEGERRRKKRRRKVEAEGQEAPGVPARAPEERRKKKRRAARADRAGIAIAGAGAAPVAPSEAVASGQKVRRARKQGAVVRLKGEGGRLQRGGRKSKAQEPQPQPTASIPGTVPNVGRAPFAPRIPRDPTVSARASDPVGADGALTSERLTSLLRGGSVRR